MLLANITILLMGINVLLVLANAAFEAHDRVWKVIEMIQTFGLMR